MLAAALAAAIAGIAVFAVAAATASSSTALSRPTVFELVHLLRHDQQGVSIADQAAVQSPDAPERARAALLARTQQAGADRLDSLLRAHHVPSVERYSVPAGSSLPLPSNATSPCDLASDDELSHLATTAPAGFDSAFLALARRHVTGGAVLLADVPRHTLSTGERAALDRDQADLATIALG